MFYYFLGFSGIFWGPGGNNFYYFLGFSKIVSFKIVSFKIRVPGGSYFTFELKGSLVTCFFWSGVLHRNWCAVSWMRECSRTHARKKRYSGNEIFMPRPEMKFLCPPTAPRPLWAN